MMRDKKTAKIIEILVERKDSENRNRATEQEKINALLMLDAIRIRNIDRDKQMREKYKQGKEVERQEILTYLTGLMSRVELREIVDWESVTLDIRDHLTYPLDIGGSDE
jgi:hypothetical protein